MKLTLKLKKLLGTLGCSVCMVGASAPAHAGIPVIDAANLAQAIQEVIAWGQQASDMVKSIQEAKNMVNDPNIRAVLPSEMQNAVGVLMSPSGVTSNAASMSNVLASFGITVPTGRISKAAEFADLFLKSQAILQSAQTRDAQLTQLATAVDGAPDAKASSDLVARNSIENARIMNTLVQQMAAMEMAKQQAEMRAIGASQAEQARQRAYYTANPLP
jgi:type IV secretion system protein VirB5